MTILIMFGLCIISGLVAGMIQIQKEKSNKARQPLKVEPYYKH